MEAFFLFNLFVCPPLIMLLLIIVSRFRQLKPYPPGPRGWPVIGNMNMMAQLTHRGLAKLAKQYGGVLHLRIGSVHIIAISSPDAARQVLQVQDNIFSNKPSNTAIRYLTYDRADMAFADYGPFWRQMRKLCVTNLFSRKRTESWDPVRESVDIMIRSVVAGGGDTAVNIGEMAFRLTMNIIYRAAFGSSSDKGQDEFIKIMMEFSELFGAFHLSDFFPWLGWIDPKGFRNRLVDARSSLDGFIDRIIDDHMQKMKGGTTDMVDELLAFYSDEVKVDEDQQQHNFIKLTKNNIKAIIMDVMFGGTDTVTWAIEWTMAELIKSPSDLKKVQLELVDVVGLTRKVEEPDFDKLSTLRYSIKEALRLHPPIPLLLHETAEAATVYGYHIPAKSRVMINVWAIGRDAAAWDEPDEFKPSRFTMDGGAEFRGGNFTFLPFGSGRRSCPGMQFGLYVVEMALAHLLHCFTWELPTGMKPSELDMRDVFGLTAPRVERLVAVPTPRLLCPLN